MDFDRQTKATYLKTNVVSEYRAYGSEFNKC